VTACFLNGFATISRYKYPPVWVMASELFSAMNTTDADSQNREASYSSRGLAVQQPDGPFGKLRRQSALPTDASHEGPVLEV